MSTIVYAVLEYNQDEPESRKSLSKLFTRRDPAERWASIKEDESYMEFHSGRESVLYSYVVEPWELHDE